MSFTIIKIPLTESRHTTHVAYSKLSAYAKKLVRLMVKIYTATNRNNFSLDDIRQYSEGGTWRDIRDGFYELESRAFGVVKSDGSEIFFSAYIPVLQSKLDEAVNKFEHITLYWPG